MTILILGSNGILSGTLKNYLINKKIKFFTLSREKKSKQNYFLRNFSNFNELEIKIKKIKPKYIINCIGITKFNNSYNNKTKCNEINKDLPKFLSNLCLKNKIYFTHISTDCVFKGDKGNYKDNSHKDSKEHYGLSKNLGEVKNKYSATLRTSFIGPEINSNKQLLNWFLSQSNSVNGFTKAYFTGITSLELSKIIHNFYIKKNIFYNRIVNIGGIKISKYEVLKIISSVFKKKIIINKYDYFLIDRSLNVNYFIKISKYKIKSWRLMLLDLKKFMILNNYKF